MAAAPRSAVATLALPAAGSSAGSLTSRLLRCTCSAMQSGQYISSRRGLTASKRSTNLPTAKACSMSSRTTYRRWSRGAARGRSGRARHAGCRRRGGVRRKGLDREWMAHLLVTDVAKEVFFFEGRVTPRQLERLWRCELRTQNACTYQSCNHARRYWRKYPCLKHRANLAALEGRVAHPSQWIRHV